MKLDFNDILIVPASTSSISTRKDVNPFYNGHLPLIAAPMDTVIDKNNLEIYESLGINVCIPRNSDINALYYNNGSSINFVSFGLDEFIEKYIENYCITNTQYILIDIANGHMDKLTNTIVEFKEIYGSFYKLMVGNVANPKTYKILSLAGADYIRIGIGAGSGCSTTVHTAVGYPMASLISDCYTISLELEVNQRGKIVADGGMKNYSDVIKAIALGADYVMVGGIFNKALESAGDTYLYGLKINQFGKLAKWALSKKLPLKKKFHGMSTKEVQRKWNKSNIKTSEGVSRINNVEYSLSGWTANFIDYFRSAMSYTDCKTIEEFRGMVEIIEISDSAYTRFSK